MANRKSRRAAPKKPPYSGTYLPRTTLAEKLRAVLTPQEWRDFEKELERMLEDTKHKASDWAMEAAWSIVMRVLIDKFSFSPDDIQKLWIHTESYADEIESKTGGISLDDIVNSLAEEDKVYMRIQQRQKDV